LLDNHRVTLEDAISARAPELRAAQAELGKVLGAGG
jgi:predicted RNA-binding protein YlqC (UPF0109 family)